MENSKEKGKIGEEVASQYLQKKGYSIIGRNWKSSYGEVDIVALKGKTVVFVEVKLRRDNSLTFSLEAITPLKIERIRKTALLFLSQKEVRYEEVRFDVIGITQKGKSYEIVHLENVF